MSFMCELRQRTATDRDSDETGSPMLVRQGTTLRVNCQIIF
jgi:hypothetical protein